MDFGLDELEAGALLCTEATIAGPQLRELIRWRKLARLLSMKG
jgi:hypothetical protein